MYLVGMGWKVARVIPLNMWGRDAWKLSRNVPLNSYGGDGKETGGGARSNLFRC